jgi:hypothetical protein
VNGSIDHLYTRLGTIGTYKAISDFHTSQIITAPAKLYPACCGFNCRFLATALTVEILQLQALTSLFGEYPSNELNSAGLGYSLYSLEAHPTENTASNSSSIAVMGGLPCDSPDIVRMFTDRYQATYVPSHYRCIATVLQWCQRR